MQSRLLLTCEHGGNRIPPRFRSLFADAADVLASHRGWDPGALPVARAIARRCEAPLLEVTVSRLLVDTNRSPRHPRVFSSYTRALPRDVRASLLEAFHAPHHRATLALASRLARVGDLLHLSVHSFTPVFDGVVRDVDLGILYDPSRRSERVFAEALRGALAERLPSLRVRRNMPYRGVSDGLTKVLRRELAIDRYAGIELEINQRFLTERPRIASLGRSIAEAVADTIRLS